MRFKLRTHTPAPNADAKRTIAEGMIASLDAVEPAGVRLDGLLTEPWQIAHERGRPWLLLTISPPIRGRTPHGVLGAHSYNEDRVFADLAVCFRR